MRAWVIGLAFVVILSGGTVSCAPRHPADPLASDDPSVKIPAMKQAARTNDRAAIPRLVADLDNDDPAIRLGAIEALRELTGQDLGYYYYQEPEARAPAVQRWRQWINPPPASSSAPARDNGQGR